MDETQGPTTLGPGNSRGGLPLKLHLDPAQYRALERIAAERKTTAAVLVEQLVLNALAHAEVPPPVESHVQRPHTTYEQATSDFTRDQPDGTLDPA